MTELTHLDATELGRIIAAREVSCVDVMAAFLDRIDTVNPLINAIVSLGDRTELLAQARQHDVKLASGRRLGPLHGFPLAVKDLTAAAGFAFTQGSPIFAQRIAAHDDLVVARMKAAGAIVIGKTNVPEFGLGSHTYNPVFGITRNPWDTTKSAGGSSGGAAAALAARLVPLADGSDYGGSLRNPAAFCNVYGLRPSLGRVPVPGFVAQLSIPGPMARSVRDLAMLLSVQSGPDDSAPISLPPLGNAPGTTVGGTRIGWVGDWNGQLPFERGILELGESTLAVFTDLGATIEHLTMPVDAESLWRTFLIWRFWHLFAARELYDDPTLRAKLKPEAQWELARANELTALDIQRACEQRDLWYTQVLELLRRVDVIAAPTAQVFPFDAELAWPKAVAGKPMDTYHQWMQTVTPWSLAGLPVLNIPAGFDERGLPTGIQLIGRPGGELALLELAAAHEQTTRWASRVPEIGVGSAQPGEGGLT